MSYNTGPERRHKALLISTLASLSLSALFVLSGIEQRSIIVSDGGGEKLDLLQTLAVLAVGLLVGGASFYTLMTTHAFKRWNNLSRQKKAIAAVPIAVGSCIGLGVIALLVVSVVVGHGSGLVDVAILNKLEALLPRRRAKR